MLKVNDLFRVGDKEHYPAFVRKTTKEGFSISTKNKRNGMVYISAYDNEGKYIKGECSNGSEYLEEYDSFLERYRGRNAN